MKENMLSKILLDNERKLGSKFTFKPWNKYKTDKRNAIITDSKSAVHHPPCPISWKYRIAIGPWNKRSPKFGLITARVDLQFAYIKTSNNLFTEWDFLITTDSYFSHLTFSAIECN